MNKKRAVLVIILILLFLAAVVGYMLITKKRSAPQNPNYNSPLLPSKAPERPPSHIVVIMQANKPLSSIAGNPSTPYINKLLRDHATAIDYHAVATPGLPNYLAVTSGTTANINDDCSPPSASCQANVVNISSAVERSGRTWKAYAESMPIPCSAANSAKYVVTHNPFMYYPNLRTNSQYCNQHIVPFTQFEKDLQSTASLPNFAFIIPDTCNGTRDCPVQTGDTWLSQKVPTILGSPAFTRQSSLLVITWDKGDEKEDRVPLIFAGPAAKSNYTATKRYNHYSLLRTIQALWQLPTFTENDEAAPLMYDMLR